MLKISLNPRIDTVSLTSFDSDRIVVKDTESGEVVEWSRAHKISISRYTAEQRDIIQRVNAIVEENLFRSMTEAEIDYLLYPLGKESTTDPESYQILAGFEVKKEIRYK